jgi:adenine-specific DNA-methyltransferase
MKRQLQQWGSEYVAIQRDDECDAPALVLKGYSFGESRQIDATNARVVSAAANRANEILRSEHWPNLIFAAGGEGGPAIKTHLQNIRKGKVPMTYWADEEYETPFMLETQSWAHQESGHSQAGINELDAIVGKGHNFKTVKPLRLFKKIIQLWCPPEGIVLDPFAGSGTSGHATLALNKETQANRRFILIEQGNTEKGDHYARSLTADRVRRVISGEWAAGKRDGVLSGFRFMELKREKIDAEAVIALAREEMIDLLLTSYWDMVEKAKSYLKRCPVGQYRYLFAVTAKNEGFFLVWEAPDKPSSLNREVYRAIVAEAAAAGLSSHYHVYASIAPYTGPGLEFYKIPEKVLEHIGFDERSDAFNNEETAHV